jgi:lysylphosphatidylglycerol synthetase-like protein (DUF2156 family)
MLLPKASFSLRQSMAMVATVAVSLALLRLNVALGTVLGCVAVTTLVRTVQVLKSRQDSQARGPVWRWLHAGLDSLAAAIMIIGAADLAFLVIYAVAKHWRAPMQSDGPPPYVDWDAVYLAIPSGLAVGFLMCLLMWNRRCLPSDDSNSAMQRAADLGRRPARGKG